jgi:hypothetical protein
VALRNVNFPNIVFTGAVMTTTHQSNENPASAVISFTDDTEQFAELNGVKAQSVRKRYSQTGSYFGIRPLQLANRRLKWPHAFAIKSDDSVQFDSAEV